MTAMTFHVFLQTADKVENASVSSLTAEDIAAVFVQNSNGARIADPGLFSIGFMNGII
jgi:hypothetical protein